jgi:diacylglycerol kinase family enzyme
MAEITRVLIVYNPNSTGNAERYARRRQQALKRRKVRVVLEPTQYAGHAEKLARDFATENPHGMVIASSGDGGYNEVINGVLSSPNPHVICGVIPAGNANDHYHFLHRAGAVRRIAAGEVDRVDVLRVETGGWTRYAHSYVGLGMTSQIGRALTKARLNWLVETWLVVKHLFKIRPVRVSIHSGTYRYDHLIFSTIGRMSKYLTLAKKTDPRDGLFEITAVESGSLMRLLKHLVRASAKQIAVAPQADLFRLTILRGTYVQMDGEVRAVPARDQVTVTAQRRALRTIV